MARYVKWVRYMKIVSQSREKFSGENVIEKITRPNQSGETRRANHLGKTTRPNRKPHGQTNKSVSRPQQRLTSSRMMSTLPVMSETCRATSGFV